MARKAAPAIHDILENIERVQTRMISVTFAEFQGSWELRFAVQRAIEIISEASRRIPDEMKNLRPEIHWRRIAGRWHWPDLKELRRRARERSWSALGRCASPPLPLTAPL